MSEVLIVDTTVFLNVLGVPGHCQHVQEVLEELESQVQASSEFLLPISVVLESGNHIADLTNGDHRWRWGEILRDQVRAAIEGGSAWGLTPLPTENDLDSWMQEFPQAAREGVTAVNVTVIKAWRAAYHKNPSRRVRIWSLNQRLQGYDRAPGF